MLERTHRVAVYFGLQSSAEFDTSMLPGQDDKHFSFIRIRENGVRVDAIGMISINLEKKRAGFLYDCFQVLGDIQEVKKVGNNYHFKCITDLFRMDIYACDPKLWLEKGQAIFLT